VVSPSIEQLGAPEAPLVDRRPKVAPTTLTPLYPILQSNLTNQDFEEIQSIIIPGGIVDTTNKTVYLENDSNNIVKVDLASGKTIRQINGVCVPIAVVDNCLLAL
jgi:hypothetical protein